MIRCNDSFVDPENFDSSTQQVHLYVAIDLSLLLSSSSSSLSVALSLCLSLLDHPHNM